MAWLSNTILGYMSTWDLMLAVVPEKYYPVDCPPRAGPVHVITLDVTFRYTWEAAEARGESPPSSRFHEALTTAHVI